MFRKRLQQNRASQNALSNYMVCLYKLHVHASWYQLHEPHALWGSSSLEVVHVISAGEQILILNNFTFTKEYASCLEAMACR